MSNRYVMLENRSVLALSGADARGFLQGLVTQDMDLLTPSHSLYSALLTAQGKYLFDFFIIEQPDAIWLECEKSALPKLSRLLSIYKLRADIRLSDLSDSHHVMVVLGDVSSLGLPSIEGRTERHHDSQVVAFVDPRLSDAGARVVAPAGEGEGWLVSRGYAQALAADYEVRRIALALPDSINDNLPEKTLLLENGFEELHGVSFTKGCYVGQEVTARSKHRASLHKLLFQVAGEQEGSLPGPSTPILQGERVVGEMRSSFENRGLALIRHEAVSNGQPLLADGIALQASIPAWRRTP